MKYEVYTRYGNAENFVKLGLLNEKYIKVKIFRKKEKKFRFLDCSRYDRGKWNFIALS